MAKFEYRKLVLRNLTENIQLKILDIKAFSTLTVQVLYFFSSFEQVLSFHVKKPAELHYQGEG